ncbi:hypothetical protein N8Z24_00520 [bacterium]|nr:hypothetical protein [bacterium]
MSIVVENPKSVRELLKLVGKPVVLGSFVYGVLALNEKTEEITIVTPGAPASFFIPIDKVNVIEEITAYNAVHKWHLKETFKMISSWARKVDWSVYEHSEGWLHCINDIVEDGHLPKNDYTVNNGLKFL